MRSLPLAAAAALLLSGCKPSCGSPGTTTPPATPPQANPSGPVPPSIQALRDADTALQAGKLDEAIVKGEAASAAAPGNPVAWNALGRAHAARFAQTKDEAEAKKARESFTRAVTASPDFWPAYQNLGELEEQTGHLQEAADAYRQVLKAQPGHPDKAKFEAAIAKAEAGKAGKP